MTTAERALERELKRAVEQAGGRCVKITPIDKGIPDRLVLMPSGRVVFVELKTDFGRVAEHQEEWIRWLRATKHEAIILRGRTGLRAVLDYLGIPPAASPKVGAGRDLTESLSDA